MGLSLTAAVVVLVAAACHAGWNAAVKVGGDRLVVLAVLNGVGAVIGAVMIVFVAVPDAAAWPYLGASVVVHLLYYLALLRQYRLGDLSQVYPLSRGLSPLLVGAGGWIFAHETLTAVQVLGLALAAAGIVSIAFHRGPPWRGDGHPVLAALTTAVIIACYTVLDAIGVRRSGTAAGYVAWLFFLDGIPLAAVTVWLRARELGAVLRREARKAIVGGALAMLSYGLVLWALSGNAMAHVSALRETSVLFAVLIGVYLLREPLGRRRIACAALIAGGLVLMHG